MSASLQLFSIHIEDNDNDDTGGDQHKWHCGTGEWRAGNHHHHDNNECNWQLQPEHAEQPSEFYAKECGRQRGRGSHPKR